MVVLDLDPKDITEGSLSRALVFLAALTTGPESRAVLQQVIDLFWLGRLSSDAVAAVGLALPVLALLFALVIYAPFVGTQVPVSQRVGGEDVPAGRRSPDWCSSPNAAKTARPTPNNNVRSFACSTR